MNVNGGVGSPEGTMADWPTNDEGSEVEEYVSGSIGGVNGDCSVRVGEFCWPRRIDSWLRDRQRPQSPLMWQAYAHGGSTRRSPPPCECETPLGCGSMPKSASSSMTALRGDKAASEWLGWMMTAMVVRMDGAEREGRWRHFNRSDHDHSLTRSLSHFTRIMMCTCTWTMRTSQSDRLAATRVVTNWRIPRRRTALKEVGSPSGFAAETRLI